MASTQMVTLGADISEKLQRWNCVNLLVCLAVFELKIAFGTEGGLEI